MKKGIWALQGQQACRAQKASRVRRDLKDHQEQPHQEDRLFPAFISCARPATPPVAWRCAQKMRSSFWLGVALQGTQLSSRPRDLQLAGGGARRTILLSRSAQNLPVLDLNRLRLQHFATGPVNRGFLQMYLSARDPRAVKKARRAAARRGRRLRIMFADEARFGRMNPATAMLAPAGIVMPLERRARGILSGPKRIRHA